MVLSTEYSEAVTARYTFQPLLVSGIILHLSVHDKLRLSSFPAGDHVGRLQHTPLITRIVNHR